MIQYNPKEWFTFIFRLHTADTIRALAKMMFYIAIYTFIIAYLEKDVFKLLENNTLKNITVMHQLLGMVISLLLVFRTNTAYDRWYEGRKLWGSLVNNSRNLAIKLATYLGKDSKALHYFNQLIPAYPLALRSHLMNPTLANELFDAKGFDDILDDIDVKKHVPNQIAKAIQERIVQLHQNGQLTDTHLLLLNEELKGYAEICGACERIKNTPIPFSYSLFLKKFIFFYVMTFPFGYVFSLNYWVIPVTVFIFYVLASLELIAEEIEDPFGTDSNDLPMQKIATNIKKHVSEILS